jgi:hypothetical protein
MFFSGCKVHIFSCAASSGSWTGKGCFYCLPEASSLEVSAAFQLPGGLSTSLAEVVWPCTKKSKSTHFLHVLSFLSLWYSQTISVWISASPLYIIFYFLEVPAVSHTGQIHVAWVMCDTTNLLWIGGIHRWLLENSLVSQTHSLWTSPLPFFSC